MPAPALSAAGEIRKEDMQLNFKKYCGRAAPRD